MAFQNTLISTMIAAAGLLLQASNATAQSSSFPHIDGKSCPGGFTQSRGMCTSSKGDKEGMVKSGGCPKGFTDTGAYCYREVKAEKSGGSSAGKSSGSSQPDPTPDQTFAYKSITARVKKANEIDLCPTGHFTNRQDISECVTHFSDAPKSRLASGGKCNAGETLERGKYCTGATSMSAQDMDNAMTADFNELYTAYGIKHNKVPTLDNKAPEVAAPAVAALQAEKNGERVKRDAVDAEARRKAEAEQAALNNHRNDQQRSACEAGRANFPMGYPAGHPCAAFNTSAPAPSAAATAANAPAGLPAATPAAANPKDALKQGLKGLLGK
jgi:hypothetical protein